MCDYSLHALASRPARAGEKLVSTSFPGTATRGFRSESERDVAVCLMPGTELGFESDVRYRQFWFWKCSAGFSVARFRKIEAESHEHQDALEFPDGRIVLLTTLLSNQRAHVLQLPPTGKGYGVARTEREVKSLSTPDSGPPLPAYQRPLRSFWLS